MTVKVTNNRPKTSRKKWITISVRTINGVTEEIAKFLAKYPGDVEQHIARLSCPHTTVEEIIID